MTKPESTSSIDRLLQDRAQFVSWLTRLNSSESVPSVPEAVRSRVRADYERRLEAVLEELRGHNAALETQVTALTARHVELSTRESEFKEQLAEAEVRHIVGEYDDSKWQGIRAELMKVVLQVREELNHTQSEIERLSEVLATIRAPVQPEPQPAAPVPALNASAPRPAVSAPGPKAAVSEPPRVEPVPVAPAPSPAASEPARPAAQGGTEIPFRAATPKTPTPKPAPKKEEVPGRTLWFPSGKPNETGGKLDELAFLKSVTGGESQAAAPAPAPAPSPPPAPTPVAKPRSSGGFTRPATIEAPPPEPTAPRASGSAPGDKDRQSGQKTLKCAECGTLNRPTEWYCERCGAELAAL